MIRCASCLNWIIRSRQAMTHSCGSAFTSRSQSALHDDLGNGLGVLRLRGDGRRVASGHFAAGSEGGGDVSGRGGLFRIGQFLVQLGRVDVGALAGHGLQDAFRGRLQHPAPLVVRPQTVPVPEIGLVVVAPANEQDGQEHSPRAHSPNGRRTRPLCL